MQTTALGYLEFESLTHQRPAPGILRHGSADSTLQTSGGEDAIPATIPVHGPTVLDDAGVRALGWPI